jgi:N-acetylglucosamine kinase-like BadF-type ATPase
MTLVLGVDGGGRKTYAVVVDELGAVVGGGATNRGSAPWPRRQHPAFRIAS